MSNLYRRFHYLHNRILVNDEERLMLERVFGFYRSIRNYLLTLFEDFNDQQARAKVMDSQFLENKIIQYLNGEQIVAPNPETILQPGLVNSLIIQFQTEWDDFSHYRTDRPRFRSHSDTQRLYLLQTGLADVRNGQLTTIFLPDHPFRLSASKFEVHGRPTVYLLIREGSNYYLAGLYEQPETYRPVDIDPTLYHWGVTLMALDQGMKRSRRHLRASPRPSLFPSQDPEALKIRKNALDRLLRQREEKFLAKQIPVTKEPL